VLRGGEAREKVKISQKIEQNKMKQRTKQNKKFGLLKIGMHAKTRTMNVNA